MGCDLLAKWCDCRWWDVIASILMRLSVVGCDCWLSAAFVGGGMWLWRSAVFVRGRMWLLAKCCVRRRCYVIAGEVMYLSVVGYDCWRTSGFAGVGMWLLEMWGVCRWWDVIAGEALWLRVVGFDSLRSTLAVGGGIWLLSWCCDFQRWSVTENEALLFTLMERDCWPSAVCDCRRWDNWVIAGEVVINYKYRRDFLMTK